MYKFTETLEDGRCVIKNGKNDLFNVKYGYFIFFETEKKVEKLKKIIKTEVQNDKRRQD